jgi:hypothetical protein
MVIAEDEIVDRFHLESVIVPEKIRAMPGDCRATNRSRTSWLRRSPRIGVAGKVAIGIVGVPIEAADLRGGAFVRATKVFPSAARSD